MFRSLRVQVLLWTILPLLIILVTFSLSGVGSHQVSVRQLVVEGGQRFLKPLNPTYPITLCGDDCELLGVAIQAGIRF